MGILLKLSQEIEIEQLARDINFSVSHDEDDIFNLIVALEKQNENFDLLERLHKHFETEYDKYEDE